MARELVVVGGGNMGAALLMGMVSSGEFEPSDVAVVEPLAERRAVLTGQFPGVLVTDSVPECDGAVLAVKPHDVPEVAAGVAAAGARRLLSIAAGVTTATIAAAAGTSVAVVRAMPNTPALVGKGVSAITAGPGAGDDDLEWAERILGSVGMTVRAPESQFDAVTGLTGSGPAYVFLVAEALIDAGVAAGLEPALVESMVSQLFVGSAALLAAQGDPAALRAMVTSPGGTTAAGVGVLEQRQVRAAFVEAVRAATQRSRELGGGRTASPP
ncbi:MAG: pyrroline-5-carboxylate reductase [Ilumatobacteraceae bacterium]